MEGWNLLKRTGEEIVWRHNSDRYTIEIDGEIAPDDRDGNDDPKPGAEITFTVIIYDWHAGDETPDREFQTAAIIPTAPRNSLEEQDAVLRADTGFESRDEAIDHAEDLLERFPPTQQSQSRTTS